MKQAKATEIPPELSMYVPRAVRLSGAGRAVAAVAIAMTAASAVIPALLWRDRERKAVLRHRIEREGIPAEAVITSTGLEDGQSDHRFADYRYAGGAGRVLLHGSEHPRPGDRITVRYLPGEPARSWAVGHEPAGLPLPALPVLAGICLPGPCILVFGVHRQWRLLAEGRVAVGRIVALKKNKRSDGRAAHRAEYEITLLSGAVRRIWADAGKGSAEGSLTPVLYDPENPKRLSRYPLTFVRLDR